MSRRKTARRRSERLRRWKRPIVQWLAVHLAGRVLIPLLVRSWRIELDDDGGALAAINGEERFVIAFWHNRQVPFVVPLKRLTAPVQILVSRHGDGEIAARVAARYGIGTVRGSSTRGGVTALRQLVRASRTSHLCITPDGPVGPRYRFKSGAVLVAAAGRRPILGVSWSADRVWCFKSWDRFMLPKPFAKVRYRAMAPVAPPRDLAGEALEKTRARIERRLCRLTAELDREMGHVVDPMLWEGPGTAE